MTKHEAIVTLTKLFGHDPEVNQALKIALMMLIDALDTEAPAEKSKPKPVRKKDRGR